MSTSETRCADFADRAARRATEPEPDWFRSCQLHSAVARSLRKFQVGESSDGAHPIVKADAAGAPDYATALRLFVAEEQPCADAGGAAAIRRRPDDRPALQLRRLMGLRLMVLAVAEVVALRYYRALADGGRDTLLVDV
ncbi:hypothetical protein R1CP_39365 (plasmid) [Rhodococcus opacus]|uniref:Uncharacterized protein n=1 Tax=Rhodococcus opacus TaxID=37919 RepID=A0A1B1KIL4_RHOOP|nr:hypothetical protein [Rhodococcus opacus]ANS32456.1 hypothetical protein R1CP_39365 [Rhodococcus opacus]